jgi:hypothetical protein
MFKSFLLMLLFAIPGFSPASFLDENGGMMSLAVIPAPPPRLEKDVALVLKTAGQVEVSPSTDGAWLNATRGTRLHAGNQIRTGDNALAAIVFTDDKSLLKVRSNSKVVINGKRQESASSSRRIAKTIAMEFGGLWAKVTKGTPSFRVETPSGVAAIKGTIFYCLLDASGNFWVICLDGLVELINQFGRVLVNSGETGISSPNQAPVSRPTEAQEMPNWANDGEDGGEMEFEFRDENGQKKKLKIRYQ